ncbi:hypothetical protein NAEGRDRAFT_82316 [Naegleria gruberi]|uniref:Uncharacterized protein n=1 Tax=Naegleria gruberi TaxID=5762 RepID=D2W4H1_NAEGR|nr:uncharacterized protein NAEGRDRAFT_82316 [Naegleria gruberi]EFC36031.1 hypothetical protein NAEGRDRAFT_82316 [Naegleria gruberi]|eukprot:XP_002668775.1 hypothetical protein NAEGRDRAFT_82316 [Naegleria gruberi strain NEG-M]
MHQHGKLRRVVILFAFTLIMTMMLVMGQETAKTKLFKNMISRTQNNQNYKGSTKIGSVQDGVWTNVFQLFGFRSANNQTDTDNNPKFISLFYDGIHQRMRMDGAGLGGPAAQLSSTSVLFEILRYYMNVVSVDFCIFEHLHPNSTAYGARVFPFSGKGTVAEGGFTVAKYSGAKLIQSNAILEPSNLINGMQKRVCNVYNLDGKSDLAIGLGFYLFNYQGPTYVDMTYYEDAKTGQPVRFEMKDLGGFKGITSWDVLNFQFFSDKDDSANVFSKDLFYWNAKPTCH